MTGIEMWKQLFSGLHFPVKQTSSIRWFSIVNVEMSYVLVSSTFGLKFISLVSICEDHQWFFFFFLYLSYFMFFVLAFLASLFLCGSLMWLNCCPLYFAVWSHKRSRYMYYHIQSLGGWRGTVGTRFWHW